MRVRRWWAWPLVPLYWAGLRVKDGLRRVGVLRVRRLGWPVVGVGSLSAGGAGKTPVVIALAEMLKARGWGVDVLSRGYGREGSDVERVESWQEKRVLRDAQDDNFFPRTGASLADAAKRFGDEPVLIAHRTGVPVWVGADRFDAGAMAEGTVEVRGVHLLDDGFQHRQLTRALDVVLVTAEDLKDVLLPAGNLREGLWALRRANVVVIRDEEWAGVEPKIRGKLSAGASVWRVRRQLRFPEPLSPELRGMLSAGLRPMAFCAIARPEGFAEMLANAGCGVVETMAFGDHHRYVDADVERLVEVARGCGATGFWTTEKDAVKLSAAMLERLRAVGPVCVARLEAKFVDEDEVMRELEARIR